MPGHPWPGGKEALCPPPRRPQGHLRLFGPNPVVAVAPIAGFAELGPTPVLHLKSNNHLLPKSVFRTIVEPESVIKPTGGRSRRSYQRRIVLMPQERSVQ